MKVVYSSLCVLLCIPFFMNAQESFDSSKYLTGDWKEARQKWIETGINPFLSYVSIAASNVSGGIDQNTEYAGQIYAGINLDFEKLLGWKGTRAKMSMVNRHGKGLMNEVGSIFEPITIIGGQTTFLYDLSVEKDFGKDFSWKVGRMAATDDFSVSPLYSYSLNNAINGPIRALLLDGLMSSFPFPVWGTRLNYTPNETHRFQAGAYQLSERMFDSDLHGLDFSFRSSDGLSSFFQYDWLGKIKGHDTRVYVGTHQAFGTFDHLDDNNDSSHFMRVYGHIDVEVKKDIKTFLTMAYSGDNDIARLPFQSSFGINWKGLFNARPNDRALFFATYGGYSEEFGNAENLDLDHEIVLELGYRFQITNYFVVQPAVQYDIQPGGSGTIQNSVIPGVWFEANF